MNEPKIVFVLLTYQRPKILGECLRTLFNNTKIRPSCTWILDDCSDIGLKYQLLNVSQNFSTVISPIHLVLAGKNRGISYNFEMAYNIMRQDEENEIYCFLESDYLFRVGWLEDVVAVFDASPWTIAISGVDHPDMDQRFKTHGEFCELMINQFGEDLEQREIYYKPFKLETKRGIIEVEGVSNSCGCQIVHWGRLKEILKCGDLSHGMLEFSTENYWEWMDRAFHKNGTGDRKFASDAHMSGTLSFFGAKYMEYKGVDMTKNFPFLNICDFSLSQHIAGQGVNGMICPEGTTFVLSPSWNENYLKEDPRNKIDNIVKTK